MEKLPMNKKKATLLKTWKRRFFRATDGWLYYYEVQDQVIVIHKVKARLLRGTIETDHALSC